MKRRILVVDDEPAFTQFAKLALESMGHYHVVEENNSRNAIKAARNCDPDVIILDVMMPGLNGNQVAAALREDVRLRDVPILFLTALVSQQDSGDPIGSLGHRHYLPKPVDLAQLVQRIEGLCSKQRAAVSVTLGDRPRGEAKA